MSEVQMRVHVAGIVSAVLLSTMLTGQAAHAECVIVGVQEWLKGHEDWIVLKGTATSITEIVVPEHPERHIGFKVTLDVERFWKGSVGKRVELYVDLKAENPQFEPGHSTIFAATVLGDAARQRLGITGTDTLAPLMCSDLHSESEITNALGTGKEPPKEPASRGSWLSAPPVDDHRGRTREP
jgi:hypothetical protein